MDTMPIDAVVMDPAACFQFLEDYDANVVPAPNGRGKEVIIHPHDVGELRASGRTLIRAVHKLVARLRCARRESLRGVLDREVQRG